MNSNITSTTLDNGLQVILKEVHTSPIISSWIWYRVGSRNEVEGATGLAHWVEHMMFKGSAHFPKGSIMRLVDRYGGDANAMTSHDFTAYYETLPSAQALLALQIEADRMISAAFDPVETETERTVIIAEREGNENEPSFVLREEVSAAAFHVHPYHHQTIGWKSDLERLTQEELYSFYKTYYGPQNAILVIVGDFQPHEILAQIADQFGPTPASPKPVEIRRPEPTQRGERRLTVRLPGSTPIIRIAYHVPPVAHSDYLPLVILDGILSGGHAPFSGGGTLARSARLYRALVETQLASSASSYYQASLDAYLFNLGAVVRQDRKASDVEDALLEQVRKLQEETVPPSDLQIAIRQTQAQLAFANESVNNQALALGMLAIVDDYARLDGFLDELATVTPGDIMRVAQTYLVPDNRVVGWFEPLAGGA
ncbi:MAG: M16 family metallopeptidase [Anaerolineae bacterium]